MTLDVLRVATTALARANEIEQAVLLAIHAHLDQVENIAGGRALDPKFIARRAPETGDLRFEGFLQRDCVGVSQNENFVRVGMLDDDRENGDLSGGDLLEFQKIEGQGGAFFEFVMIHDRSYVTARHRAEAGYYSLIRPR